MRSWKGLDARILCTAARAATSDFSIVSPQLGAQHFAEMADRAPSSFGGPKPKPASLQRLFWVKLCPEHLKNKSASHLEQPFKLPQAV